MFNKTRSLKLVTAFLILVLAILTQFKLLAFFGLKLDLVLAVLIALTPFIDTEETILFAFLSAWALNVHTTLDTDIVFFVLIAIFFALADKFFPLESWVSNFLSLFIGLTLFYSLVDYTAITRSPAVFVENILPSVIFGMAVFQFFDIIYAKGNDKEQIHLWSKKKLFSKSR